MKHISKWALLQAMYLGWGEYLTSVEQLLQEEKIIYLTQQNFHDARVLLRHICVRAEEIIQIASCVKKDHSYPSYLVAEGCTLGEYNQDRYQWYRGDDSEIKTKVETSLFSLELLINWVCEHVPYDKLSKEGLYQDNLYPLVYDLVVEHYMVHRPPNGIDVRALVEG